MTSRVVPLTDQLEPLVIAVTRQYTMATSLADTGVVLYMECSAA